MDGQHYTQTHLHTHSPHPVPDKLLPPPPFGRAKHFLAHTIGGERGGRDVAASLESVCGHYTSLGATKEHELIVLTSDIWNLFSFTPILVAY